MIAIQSNDIEEYPEDRPELMHAEKETRDYRFPYLFDESQQVAKDFQATCTPDFFLFDGDQRLVYRGRIDETRPTRIASGVYDSKWARTSRKRLERGNQGYPPGRTCEPPAIPFGWLQHQVETRINHRRLTSRSVFSKAGLSLF